VLGGWAAGGSTGVARAQGGPAIAEGPAAAAPVDVTVVGKPADLERVRALGGEHTPGGVPLRWGRIDHFDPLADVLRASTVEPPPPLRCWVDMTETRRVVLYFAARGGQRFLVRGVELSGRFDELDRQSLAQVLELSISALLESAEVGITRSEARVLLSRPAAPPEPPPAATPVVVRAPPPEAPSAVVTGAIFYAGQELGAGMPVAHGPGADVALRLTTPTAERRTVFGLWASGQYQLPIRARTEDVGMQLQTLAARAGLEAERWRLRARLGAGGDWVRVAPLAGSATTEVTLAPAHWSTSLVVTATLALLVPAGRRLELRVAASADILPTAVHYDVQGPTGPLPAFTPWRIRPGLSLEVGF
jgi:hypothetical protein